MHLMALLWGLIKILFSYLPAGRYHDLEGGLPRVRLTFCTPGVLNPAVSPNVGNLMA